MSSAAGEQAGKFKNVIHGDKAEELLRKVALTAGVQRRCCEAIRTTMLLRDARSRALNRLLDEALAR